MESLERKDTNVGTEEPVKSEGLVDPSPAASERNIGGVSPPPHCSICLGNLVNTSFTDSCLHQFCFTCLLQWAKIKTECPLCKQTFKSIIHNVRSEGDYDQYHVQYTQVAGTLDIPADHINRPWDIIEGLRPAVQRSFMYRTTNWANNRRLQIFLNPEAVARREQLPSIAPSLSSEERRSRSERPLEFRQRIYRTGARAVPLPDTFGNFRGCSASYYRIHPEEIQRLIPWLNRELQAVIAEQHHIVYVLNSIVSSLTRINIKSSAFSDIVSPYFRIYTEHFQHEFYNFACSNFDMVGYDQTVEYRPSRELSDELVPSALSPDSSSSSSSSSISATDTEISIIDMPLIGGALHLPPRQLNAPGTSSFGPGFRHFVEPDIVTVSSASSGSEGECEVVGVVKPRHERTPEIIDLSSEEEVANAESTSTSQELNQSVITLPKEEEKENEEEEEEEDLNLPSTSTSTVHLNTSSNRRTRRRPEDGNKFFYDYMVTSSESNTDETDSDYNPSSKSKSRSCHKSSSKKSSKSSRKLRSRTKSTGSNHSSRKKRCSKTSLKRNRSASSTCSEKEDDPSPTREASSRRGTKRYLSKSSDHNSDCGKSNRKKVKKSKKSKSSKGSKRRCLLIPTSNIPKARIYSYSSSDSYIHPNRCDSSSCSDSADCDVRSMKKKKCFRKIKKRSTLRKSVSYTDLSKENLAKEDTDKPSCSKSTGATRKPSCHRRDSRLVDYDFSDDGRSPRHSLSENDDNLQEPPTNNSNSNDQGSHSSGQPDENNDTISSPQTSKSNISTKTSSDSTSVKNTEDNVLVSLPLASSSKFDLPNKYSELSSSSLSLSSTSSSSSSSSSSKKTSQCRRQSDHEKCKETKTRRRSYS